MDEFFDVLVRYETELWAMVDARLAASGEVSLAKLEALRVIDRHGGAGRVQELSHDLAITVGAASKFADRLVADGLVERSPNPADRRSALIALTASGRLALEGAEGVAARALEVHLGGVPGLPALTTQLAALRARLATDAAVTR